MTVRHAGCVAAGDRVTIDGLTVTVEKTRSDSGLVRLFTRTARGAEIVFEHALGDPVRVIS